jgi:hypothetical protein
MDVVRSDNSIHSFRRPAAVAAADRGSGHRTVLLRDW